jgi:hypothetical protein
MCIAIRKRRGIVFLQAKKLYIKASVQIFILVAN